MLGEGEGHGGVDEGGEVGVCECYGGEAALGWEGEGDVEVRGWEWEWDGVEGEGEGCSVRGGEGGAVRTALGGHSECFCLWAEPVLHLRLMTLKPTSLTHENVCEFWTTSNDCIVCTGLVCSQNFLSTHFHSSILPHNGVQCSALSSNDRIAK